MGGARSRTHSRQSQCLRGRRQDDLHDELRVVGNAAHDPRVGRPRRRHVPRAAGFGCHAGCMVPRRCANGVSRPLYQGDCARRDGAKAGSRSAVIAKIERSGCGANAARAARDRPVWSRARYAGARTSRPTRSRLVDASQIPSAERQKACRRFHNATRIFTLRPLRGLGVLALSDARLDRGRLAGRRSLRKQYPKMRWSTAIAVAFFIAVLMPVYASAGTTGGITGRVVDSQTRAPLAGVSVAAGSPSQSATSTTDATGTFRFLTLNPDTYTISFSKAGYDPLTQPGLTVAADQVQTYNVSLNKALRTIARVVAQSAASLVKPGTTSDVYSVDAAGQQAAQGLTGPGSLNNAYGAIASVPGVELDQNEQGWWQTLKVRGGDIDQVGYELDGIPVNRAYDNAPQTMLSSLGSQEVQVYTGGVPASSDAQGISGYVNQVIKTGTYPGFATGVLSAGYPAFFHQASVEAGGSTPDRLFSYYVGIGGSNQQFRYIDNNDGSSIPNSFFYPVNPLPGNNGFVYTGPNSPTLFTTGLGFALANQSLRDDILNFHFGIPHKNSGLRDDVQLLWMTSENVNQYFSSTNDFGANVVQNLYGPLTWDDTYFYAGQPMQPFNPSQVGKYFFPESMPHAFQGVLPNNLQDPNENGVALEKLQYQHVF